VTSCVTAVCISIKETASIGHQFHRSVPDFGLFCVYNVEPDCEKCRLRSRFVQIITPVDQESCVIFLDLNLIAA